MKSIIVLGSTGSIGTQTLDVIRSFPGEFDVVGLSARTNKELLLAQAWEFHPQYLFCQDWDLDQEIPPGCRTVPSIEHLVTESDAEFVMQGMVGNVGLLPTLTALRSGKQLGLANKEPIVMAGQLLVDEVRRSNGTLIPVDSEPSAISQCLRGENGEHEIRRLILTASGGAFRSIPLEQLDFVTPRQALQHPTWSMGPKITVDCATLMNKAFEVIEARWLFGVGWDQIQVLVHPQSTIHSMVEFNDGSVKAQLGPTDMRLPIQHALFYPKRVSNPSLPQFDLTSTDSLSFEPLDEGRYPCFVLGVEAGKLGGTYPTALTAADETAVGLFLQDRIRFTDIRSLVAAVLDEHTSIPEPELEEILMIDVWARENVVKRALALSW